GPFMVFVSPPAEERDRLVAVRRYHTVLAEALRKEVGALQAACRGGIGVNAYEWPEPSSWLLPIIGKPPLDRFGRADTEEALERLASLLQREEQAVADLNERLNPRPLYPLLPAAQLPAGRMGGGGGGCGSCEEGED